MQSFKDIEIICVDDGSTDDSPEMLIIYAEKDNRIKIITQKNTGAGAARNAGLKEAKGKYIIFWDSDDFFEINALEKLYNRAEEMDADICICNAQDFDSDSHEKLYHNYLRPPLPEEEVFNIKTFPKYFYTFTSPVTWNKLIRRDIFTENNIRFGNTKHINDVLGTYMAMSVSLRITLLNDNLIYYRVNREGSLMNTNGDNVDDVFTAYSALQCELQRRNLLKDEDILCCFKNKVWSIFVINFRYCNTFEDFKSYTEKLKKEWLPNLDMGNLTDGYIYNKDQDKEYKQLMTKSSEDFLYYLFCFQSDLGKKRRQKMTDYKTERDDQRKQLKKFKLQNEKLLKESKDQKDRFEKKLEKKDNKIEKIKEELKNRNNELKKAKKDIDKLSNKLKKADDNADKQKRLLQRKLVRLAVKISNYLTKLKKRFKHGR